MLDLNLDIVSSDSSCDENMMMMMMNKVNGEGVMLMEDSGSTKSSIINDEDVPSNNGCRDENSSNTGSGSTAFVFDILKKETDDGTNTIAEKVENPSLGFLTRELFPVAGEKTGVELEFGTKPDLARPQWLNLSYAESTGEAELTTTQVKPQPRKSRRGPRSRSSQYRGVTFYRRTGRWESHIWDCGKQVYLGGFDTAHAAARAYDRAAIKFRGVEADINFSLSDYDEDMKQMKHMNKEEFVHTLRRQSNGFSRGNSKYRGVTLNKCGRWEARMGQLLGKKAYDMAAMKCNGSAALTNFEPSTYEGGGSKCDHNLDLSLGISTPSVARKGINDAGDFRFSNAAIGVQPQHGLTMASKHPPMMSGVYPAALLPYNEERAIPRRAEAGSSMGYSNWAWQVQGDGKNFSSTPVFPIAASSGFSTVIPSSTTLPFDSSGRNPKTVTPTNIISSHYHNYRS